MAAAVCALLVQAPGDNALAHTRPDAPDAAAFFRAAAIADVAAMTDLLQRNHPGASPEVADGVFRTDLEAASRLARRRAETVNTAEGYIAVLSGFANALGDRHLSFRPGLSVSRPNWVGLVIAKRGDDWRVADEEAWPGRAPLKGAELISCDGRPIQQVAEERLGGFRADWTIEAQQRLTAPWLLIDERNPFLDRLETCDFDTPEGRRTIPMDWRPVSRDSIAGRLHKAAGAGFAGYGVRRSGPGWWVSIGEFTAQAPAVIEQARSLQSDLRSAPFVVVDIRGNGGGASDLGDQLARILYGDDAVPASDDCPAAWRVSPENLARLESYPRLFRDRLSPEVLAEIEEAIQAMRTAKAGGRAFSRPLSPCVRTPARSRPTPRVLILTDRVCFSSCLLVVQRFRELGAWQIGEATNANTHYQENRREPLPSGLGDFGLQATIDLSQPARVGPFEPHLAYGGDLTDTVAVEAWVLDRTRDGALGAEPPR